MKYIFDGKKFVVTGASSGIGKKIASDIAEAGGSVLAIARNEARLEELRFSYPDRISIASADVRDYDAVEHAIDIFVSEHGKVSGLAHVAGLLEMTPLQRYDEEKARNLFDVHFWSFGKLLQYVNKKKNSEDGCSYVMISSVSAYKGEAAQFALSASKASLQVMARTFAKEIYKRKNRINTISPGLIMTELTERDFDERGVSPAIIDKHLLGLGKPEDVSNLTLYLLSDAARWITGQDYVIDGGYLVSD